MGQVVTGRDGGREIGQVLSVTGRDGTFNNLIVLINSKYKVMKTGVTPRHTSMVIALLWAKTPANAFEPPQVDALGAVRIGDRSASIETVSHYVK